MMTEWSLGSLGVVGFFIVFAAAQALAFQREWLVTGKAHKRELAAREREIAARETALAARDVREQFQTEDHAKAMRELRASYETALNQFQNNHQQQIEGVRADFAAQVASLRQDVDDWRGAYHLGAENWKVSEDRLDEVLENGRLMLAVVRALPRVTQTVVGDVTTNTNQIVGDGSHVGGS